MVKEKLECDKPMSEELEDGQIINTPLEGSPLDLSGVTPRSSSDSDSFDGFRRLMQRPPRVTRNHSPRARSRSPASTQLISPSSRKGSAVLLVGPPLGRNNGPSLHLINGVVHFAS